MEKPITITSTISNARNWAFFNLATPETVKRIHVEFIIENKGEKDLKISIVNDSIYRVVGLKSISYSLSNEEKTLIINHIYSFYKN